MLKRILIAAAMIMIFSIVTVVIVAADSTAASDPIEITAEPVSAEGFLGDDLEFKLNAVSNNGRELYYQWYFGVEKATDGTILQAIELNSDHDGFNNANGAELTVKINDNMLDTQKRYYVYCLVTDRDSNVVKSEKAYITVFYSKDFSFDISYKPGSEINAYVGDEAIISVMTSITESKLGVLYYQWYAGNTNLITAAEPIQGENKPYIVIPTQKAGVSYYFCKVTNEKFGRTFSSYDYDSGQYVKAVVRDNPDASQNALPFEDVDTDAWYYNDLLYAYRSGIINGRTAELFCPDEGITIAEAVKIACCIHQLNNDGKVVLINSKPWYKTYMDYALTNGIIRTDLSSRANEPVKREQFVDILYKSLPAEKFPQINTVREGAIRDVELTNQYADSIYALYRAGVIIGSEIGYFRPTENILRSEVAAVITRILDKSARNSAT